MNWIMSSYLQCCMTQDCLIGNTLWSDWSRLCANIPNRNTFHTFKQLVRKYYAIFANCNSREYIKGKHSRGETANLCSSYCWKFCVHKNPGAAWIHKRESTQLAYVYSKHYTNNWRLNKSCLKLSIHCNLELNTGRLHWVKLHETFPGTFVRDSKTLSFWFATGHSTV